MEDRWKVVYRASGMTNARIITGRLETEEIPFRLKYEAAGEIYAIVINGLGEVEILVPESFFDAAQKILSTTYDEKDLNWQNTSE